MTSTRTSLNWKHADYWTLRGTNFLLEVRRHTVPPVPEWNFDNLDSNRWTVYAYIYPKHPMFSAFTDENLLSDAANSLPLHGGASFCRLHWNHKAEQMSVQVGCDYSHYGDDAFSHLEAEDASVILADAETLYNFLENAA